MHRSISALFAAGLAANGGFMVVSPSAWYAAVPGVSDTGPFNPHFVRDIGSAFLVSALGFAWMVVDRRRAWPAAIAGAAFLCLHALVHVVDLLAGRESLGHLAGDLPAIFLPAVLALWLARPPSRPKSAAPRRRAETGKPRGLVARLAEPSLAAFERRFDYDTTYLRQVVQASGTAFFHFYLFSRFAEHREDTPTGPWFAAKLAAVLREDCGPCTELVVRMAEQQNVPATDLIAVLAGDAHGMSQEVALAFQFTRAVLDRDIVASNRLRSEVVERWGDRGLVTLAFTMAAARVYPTLKYALGYGQACSRVSIGGKTVTVTGSALPSPELASASARQ
jgi:hypothetical protein